MSAIKKVAVLGGGGNLGPSIVDALLSAGFEVTVLSREASSATFPSTVRVHKADYNSESSLLEGFNGQDAVVSVVGHGGLPVQKLVADTAVKAGVKRLVPSEFGINTQTLDGLAIGAPLKGKVESGKYLSKLAKENPSFSWTGISNGLFFDWGLKVGSLGFSIPNRTATIFDSGNEPFLGTNVKTIGLAVASALAHPETANRYLNIASFKTTQNEILSILEDETGQKWTIARGATEEQLKLGEEKLGKGDPSSFGHLLKHHLFRDGEGHSEFEGGLANKELDLPVEDLRETLKSAIKALS